MQRFTDVPAVTEEEHHRLTEQEQALNLTLENLEASLQEPLDLADIIEAGTATAAEQTRALVLALRLGVQVARYELGQLDTPA